MLFVWTVADWDLFGKGVALEETAGNTRDEGCWW